MKDSTVSESEEAIPKNEPASGVRVPGALAGKIRMQEGFDDPLPDDIAEAFGSL